MEKTRIAKIVATAVGLLAGAWKIVQTVFDAASFGDDTSKLWSAIVSAPDYIPWVIMACAIGVLGWTVWLTIKARDEAEALPLSPAPPARTDNPVALVIKHAFERAAAQMKVDHAKNMRKIEAKNSPRPQWQPLCAALRYLVYDTEWSTLQRAPKNETEFNEIVSVEFRERLARGDVEARGKLGWSADSLLRATESIPPSFWTDAFLQPHGEITLSDENRGLATIPSTENCYRAIILDEDQMRSTWPRRDGAQNDLTPLAQFVEPLRAKIAAESAND
jgi:hypothetical protein